MKKLGFCFLFLLTGMLAVVAQDSEKQAIIQMIEAQHKAFTDRNYDAWASYQVQTEESFRSYNPPLIGWEEISKAFKDYYKNASPTEPDLFKNYQVWVHKDKAWIIFDTFNRKTGNQKGKAMYSIRKVDGRWKVLTTMGFNMN